MNLFKNSNQLPYLYDLYKLSESNIIYQTLSNYELSNSNKIKIMYQQTHKYFILIFWRFRFTIDNTNKANIFYERRILNMMII